MSSPTHPPRAPRRPRGTPSPKATAPPASRDAQGAASGDPGEGQGFYAGQFDPEELADLVAFGDDMSLVDEIACARVALRRVIELLGREPDEGITTAEYARLGQLAFSGARTVARLLRDQRALSDDAADAITGAIGTALDELGSEWSVHL
jgi:hypothetical protein